MISPNNLASNTIFPGVITVASTLVSILTSISDPISVTPSLLASM